MEEASDQECIAALRILRARGTEGVSSFCRKQRGLRAQSSGSRGVVGRDSIDLGESIVVANVVPQAGNNLKPRRKLMAQGVRVW